MLRNFGDASDVRMRGKNVTGIKLGERCLLAPEKSLFWQHLLNQRWRFKDWNVVQIKENSNDFLPEMTEK